jgi:hypothetical protein
MTLAYAALAGLGAAGAAYALNSLALRRVGQDGLWLVVPALEEALKSGIPGALGLPIVPAHIAFGVTEAAYEVSGRRPSAVAALLAMATHAGFGLLTALLARQGGIGPAVVAAAAAHSLYNMAMVKRSGRGTRRGPAGAVSR